MKHIDLRLLDVPKDSGVGRARPRRRRHLFGCKSAQTPAVQVTVLHVLRPVEGALVGYCRYLTGFNFCSFLATPGVTRSVQHFRRLLQRVR